MKDKVILPMIFAVAVAGALLLYLNSPQLPQQHRRVMRWPQTPAHLKAMLDVALLYYQANQMHIIYCFIYSYLLLQSFAIPGAVFLSIISGPLFGGVKGFLLSQVCATLGSVCCYSLSMGLGSGLVNKVFSSPLEKLRGKVNKHRGNLFWYMLFLRMTPIVPNWFVNIAVGHVGVPLRYFALATAVGLTPNNVILVRTGLSLSEISHFGFKLQNFLLLLGLGFLSLLPTLFKGKLQKLQEKMD